MVRNRRSAFLNSLKSRLDQDLAERERSGTPPPPRWDAVQPPFDDEDDWAPEASEQPEPSNDDASIRWDEPPAEQVDDDPWLSGAADWPPQSDDQAEADGPSQISLVEQHPKTPERPPPSHQEVIAGDWQRRRPIADPPVAGSSAGYEGSDDHTARHEAEAAVADTGSRAWTVDPSEWPGADPIVAPSRAQRATARGDPPGSAPSNGAAAGTHDALGARPVADLEALDDRSGEPDPEVAWTESGLSHRLREAIASVRRISIGGRPAGSDQARERFGPEEAPEQQSASWEAPEESAPAEMAEEPSSWEATEEPASWQASEEPARAQPLDEPASWDAPEHPAGSATPEDFVPWRPLGREPPVSVAAEGRRGVRIAALVVASATVLIVGSGLGALLAGWRLELPTRAATSEPATPPATSRTPAPITEVVRLQQPPLPPAPEAAPEAVDSALPLPPPPKPAPWSSVARQSSSPPDAVGNAIDALLRETAGSGGSPGTSAAAGPRVLVHYAAGAASGPATAMHLVRQLKAAGFAVEARQVDSPIPSPSVRYYFAADRDEAEALGSSLEGQWPGGTAPPVLDFTDFQPKPPPGNLEVWVGS